MCIQKYFEVSKIKKTFCWFTFNFFYVRIILTGHLLYTNYITTGIDKCQEFRYAVQLRLSHHITTRTLLRRGPKINVLLIVITTKQINMPSTTLSKTNNPGIVQNLLEITPILDPVSLNFCFVTTLNCVIWLNKATHVSYRLYFLLAFSNNLSLVLHLTTGIFTTKSHRRVPYCSEKCKHFLFQRRLRKYVIAYDTKKKLGVCSTSHITVNIFFRQSFLTRGGFNGLNLVNIILKIVAQSFVCLSDGFVLVYSELCLEYQKGIINLLKPSGFFTYHQV